MHNECLQDEVNRLTERNELLGLERAKLVRRLNDMDLELRKLRNKKKMSFHLIRIKFNLFKPLP